MIQRVADRPALVGTAVAAPTAWVSHLRRERLVDGDSGVPLVVLLDSDSRVDADACSAERATARARATHRSLAWRGATADCRLSREGGGLVGGMPKVVSLLGMDPVRRDRRAQELGRGLGG